MTTAHRPTWAPAKGHEEEGSNRLYFRSTARSAKDIAGFTQLKMRQVGQSSASELRARDLKSELENKEKTHFDKKRNFEDERQRDLLLLEGAGAPPGGRGDSEAPGALGAGEGEAEERPRVLVPHAADADDSDQDESDSDDSDSEDEDAALLAELARIKKEREEEAIKRAAEEQRRRDEERKNEVLADNPLRAGDSGASFAMKRRWDDDVVFKNQAKDEPKQQKRFINDTIRSDFHRRFLERYIK